MYSPLIFITLYTNHWLVVKYFSNCWLYNYTMSKIIKERLSEELKNTGLTTIEISKKIGVSPEMITQYRTTKKLPKLDTFAKLCKELDLDANYILGITKN